MAASTGQSDLNSLSHRVWSGIFNRFAHSDTVSVCPLNSTNLLVDLFLSCSALVAHRQLSGS